MNLTHSYFPWLPVGYEISTGVRVRKVLYGFNLHYQIIDSQNGGAICLLLHNSYSKEKLQQLSIVNGVPKSKEIDYDKKIFYAIVFTGNQKPMRIADLPSVSRSWSAKEFFSLANALSTINSSCWLNSIYLSGTKVCLPFGSQNDKKEQRSLAIRLLTYDISKTLNSPKRINAINGNISPDEVTRFFRILKLP